jgi:hypothetical protein
VARRSGHGKRALAVPSARLGANATARHAPSGGPWPAPYRSRSYRRRRAFLAVATAVVALALLVLALSVFPSSTPR